MTKGDRWIIICVLVFSLVSYIGLRFYGSSADGTSVVIRSDGKVIETFSLNEDIDYTVQNPYGFNRIRIEEGRVYVHAASCKNQVCVGHGPIDSVGENLICLPNRVIVEIVGDEIIEVDDVSY